MNRRDFLSAAAAGAVSAGLGSAVAIGDAKTQAKAPTDTPANAKSPLAEPPPEVPYFSHERLAKAIDLSTPTDQIQFQTAAFTFNPWHPSPYMEKTFGKGWTEYETMRRAKPMFEGHYQPKRPLWGEFNEADPQWAAREIDLASSAGINAFMIDWYWHEGTQFYQEQLEQGFLKAPNRDKMKFAVMWANHHWPNCYPAPEHGQEAILIKQNYSDKDMTAVGEYLIEHYLTQPNAWRIDDKPVFAVFWTSHLIEHFTPAGLHKKFDDWQARAQKASLPGIHFMACAQFDARTPLAEAGFSSTTCYHTFAGIGKTHQTPFVEGAEWSIKVWKEQAKQIKLPYFPQCAVGWDNSPRYGHNANVVVNRTADQFERLLIAAKKHVAIEKLNPPIIFMGAWNEWTEDHYLLPDEVHSYSYLEAVRRQFGHPTA